MGERSILTAFNKQSTQASTAVMPLGLMGDEQADLSVHGGLEKAVYAYPSEHYASGKTPGLTPVSARSMTACPMARWAKT